MTPTVGAMSALRRHRGDFRDRSAARCLTAVSGPGRGVIDQLLLAVLTGARFGAGAIREPSQVDPVLADGLTS